MTYLVKFVPDAGGIQTEALFTNQAAAENLWKAAVARQKDTNLDTTFIPFSFTDDWGVKFSINLAAGTLLLFDLETQFAMMIEMDKQRRALAQKHGIQIQNPGPPGRFLGSS